MPMGFLVSSQDGVKMLPVNHCSAIDKLLDYVPDLMDKIEKMWNAEKTYTYEFYDDEDECCGCGCVTEECKCNSENKASSNENTSENNTSSNENTTENKQ